LGLVARAFALAAIASAPIALYASPAMARPFMQSSQKVALIPSNAPAPSAGPDGIMPTSSYVRGRPSDSFGKFSFSNVGLNQISTASLSQYDTVALIQVNTSLLSPAAKAALAAFVANGGKLVIHDADETKSNDYSFLLPGSYSTKDGSGCNACGAQSGTSKIVTNTGLISSNPADSSYVNLAQMGKYSDAVGDANLLVSDDPRWFALATGTNAHSESGAQLAYADNNGRIIFNGFDTDSIQSSPTDPPRCAGQPNYKCPAGVPSVDWLAQMWYSELNQSWGTPAAGSGGGKPGSTALPKTKPVSSIGKHVTASQAGLPSSKACVAKRRMFLILRRLGAHGWGVQQVNVYVNGRRVLRMNRLRNVTLRHLPKKGKFTLKILASTNRGYHLVSQVRYHAC
jgi:hypothetical protein